MRSGTKEQRRLGPSNPLFLEPNHRGDTRTTPLNTIDRYKLINELSSKERSNVSGKGMAELFRVRLQPTQRSSFPTPFLRFFFLSFFLSFIFLYFYVYLLFFMKLSVENDFMWKEEMDLVSFDHSRQLNVVIQSNLTITNSSSLIISTP